MDAETRTDLLFKVRRRVSDYIEKSNLPLERTGPNESEVVCPNCGQTAILMKLPFEDQYEFWKCQSCGEEGDAIKYAMYHLRTDDEEKALLDRACRQPFLTHTQDHVFQVLRVQAVHWNGYIHSLGD